MIRLAVFLATVAYGGYFPIAPGTVGSAAGLAVYALVAWTHSGAVEAAFIVGTFVIGTWAATHAERYFGTTDPGAVVIDEVLGMLVTLAFVHAGWSAALAGFFLFRVFDVIKPWPANRFEHFHGGVGIMADDAMAGVYANLVLRLIMWALPSWIH
ncbi:MAG: phosphatidylglycerophosphatase A family protein [Vicinamibacterales bacterium]